MYSSETQLRNMARQHSTQKTYYSTNPFKKSDQIIVLLERFFKINKNSYLNNSSQSEYELII